MAQQATHCPHFKTQLWYGRGKNQLPHGRFKFKDYFLPSIDHIKPKSHFKKYNGWLDGEPDCLDNYKICSVRYNRMMNNGFTSIDQTVGFMFDTIEFKNLETNDREREKIKKMKEIWFE